MELINTSILIQDSISFLHGYCYWSIYIYMDHLCNKGHNYLLFHWCLQSAIRYSCLIRHQMWHYNMVTERNRPVIIPLLTHHMLHKMFTQKLPLYTWVKFNNYCSFFVFKAFLESCHCSIIDIELHMLWPRDSDSIVILTISASFNHWSKDRSNKTMKPR